MSSHKMPSPRHKLIHNPIPKFCLFVVNASGKENKSSHRIGYMKFIVVLKETKMCALLMQHHLLHSNTEHSVLLETVNNITVCVCVCTV